jgi:carbonic anhydrase
MAGVLGRRSMLGFLGLCPLCLTAGRGLAADAHKPHWSYEGATGPANWAQLDQQFKACAAGAEQTPIDLTAAVRADLGKVETAFQAMPLKVVNNGHTIQVNCAPGSRTVIDGVPHELLQFHFHHPSEHLLAGKALDLECHFVHRNATGGLAVLGVFIQPGRANAALQPIWQAMPSSEGPERDAGTAIRPADLLPGGGYYRYAGSLTTPPCSEGVNWTVFKQPIEASPEQIRRFAALFPVNARPVQQRHRRELRETS